ncbi:DUF4837 family protein [Paenimyroides ceti]
MRFIWVGVILLLFSCQKSDKIRTGKLVDSTGKRNELTLVIEDSLWNGAVGDSIRQRLAVPLYGNLQDEPLFDLVQYSPKIFNSKARLARNVISFSNNVAYEFWLEKSFYATPQNFFFLRAKSSKDLIQLFHQQADSIISVFKKSELNEELHTISRNKEQDIPQIKKYFACTLKVPSQFKLLSSSNEHFVWLQRDLASGNSNLALFEVPLSAVENTKNTVHNNLLQAIDSMSYRFIKGSRSHSYLFVEDSITPLFEKTKLQDFTTYEIKGDWNVVNDFMYGPFICYAVRDDYYNRYLFLFGFVNNPYKPKRDLIFELEAISKTLNLYE